MRRAVVLLLSAYLAACGGGGGGGSSTGAPSGGGGGTPPTIPSAGLRVEESDPNVALAGAWARSDGRWGWSGGTAMQSSTAGATATFTFQGNSVRWLGSRGRGMGIATVSVDGGAPREVDLFARPSDEAHTPIVTLYDLGEGRHTLTITVTGRQNSQALGNTIVVDAFDVQPSFTVSHWQDTNPGITYAGAWSKSLESGPWSGSGVSNLPELPVTAQESSTPGASVTVPFRGTGIAWISYRGPDAGVASVQLDGGAAQEIDLAAASPTYQAIAFSTNALADTNHTLTITVKRGRVAIDAFDVFTPGRRYEEYDRTKITYVGNWEFLNEARVWSEGATATSNLPGTTATFTFTGTSVSWIGCRKGSAGGTAQVFIDGVFRQEIQLAENYPIEGYQMTVFRADGLTPGAHTLTIQVVSNNGSYVVVDAFDVR